MSSDRIEWAEGLVELWNSGDHERWLDEMGADFEFTPDPSFPDADTYGGEELRRWMRDWISTWRENRFELLGVEQVADALLMRGRWHLATRQTGGEVPLQTSRWCSFMTTTTLSGPGGCPPTSLMSGLGTRRVAALADSPVNGCMLRSTRLGCLKKPTEEARGG